MIKPRHDRLERIKLLFLVRRSILKDIDRIPEWEYGMVGAMTIAVYAADLAIGKPQEAELDSEVMKVFGEIWGKMTLGISERLAAVAAYRDLLPPEAGT